MKIHIFLKIIYFTSNLKYFCKSLIEEEREVLEKNIFKDKKEVNKKVIVIYSENYMNIRINFKK